MKIQVNKITIDAEFTTKEELYALLQKVKCQRLTNSVITVLFPDWYSLINLASVTLSVFN